MRLSHLLFGISSLFCISALQAQSSNTNRKTISTPGSYTRFAFKPESGTRFTQEAARYTQLKHLTLQNQRDSVTAAHLLRALVRCPQLDTLVLDGWTLKNIPSTIAFVHVRTLKLVRCSRINLENFYALASRMPRLNDLYLEIDQMQAVPITMKKLLHLNQIVIINRDLSLADAYALNHNLPGVLYAEDSLTLGFYDQKKGANQLVIHYGSYNKDETKTHLNIISDCMQGVLNASLEFPKRIQEKVFNYQHPLINKPIPQADVARNYYSIKAETGTQIAYPSGTNISIPKDAFVDATGTPVKGEITISYREFRDQADILLSGIPMTYDSGGSVGNFESAGMFELLASSEGQEVFLAPEKKIDMQFAVVDTSAGYNFYRLDEKKGWQYKQQLNKTIISSIAGDEYLQLTWNLTKKKPTMDTLLHEARFANVNYVYTTLFEKDEREGKKFNRYSRKLYLTRITSKDNFTVFKIHLKHDFDFPELRAYDHVVWQIDENYSSRTFKNRFRRKQGYNDIRIIYNKNGYKMILKYLNGFDEIAVKPIIWDHNKIKNVSKLKARSMNKNYKNILNIRTKRFDAGIQPNIEAYHSWKLKFFQAWNKVRKDMTNTEKQMSFEQWKEYMSKYSKLNSNRIDSSTENPQFNSLTQTLQLDGIGIFNCDQIRKIPNPVSVLAFSTTQSLKQFPAVRAVVIDKRKNMAFSYSKSPEISSISITFSRKSPTLLFLFDEMGNMAVADQNQFSNGDKFEDNRHYTFSVKAYDEKIVSPEQIRAILNSQ